MADQGLALCLDFWTFCRQVRFAIVACDGICSRRAVVSFHAHPAPTRISAAGFNCFRERKTFMPFGTTNFRTA
jgi:hypothetical protein